MIFFMCLVMVVMSAVPVFTGIDRAEAADGNEITIYFDTSYSGTSGGCNSSSHGNHDWGTSLNPVYYYAYKGSNSTGLKAMTPINKKGENGGYLFTAKVNKSTYSYILFSSRNDWKNNGTDYLWQTQNYALSGVQNNAIFKLNENGYNDGNNQKQGVYTNSTYNVGEDYSTATESAFSILNMTASSAGFKIFFTDETRNLKTGDWGDDITICCDLNGNVLKNGDVLITDRSSALTKITATTVAARTYEYNKFKVPKKNTTYDKAYQTVEIWTNDSTPLLIKKYYLPQGKILGRMLMYGVTEFSTTQESIDYGDRKKITYQTGNLGDIPVMDRQLYLDNATFYNSASSEEKASAEAVTVKSNSVSFLGKDGGNSQFKTTSNVSVDAFTAPTGTTAQTIDMSNYIYTMVYKGVNYNMFGARISGDNLISINDNVAAVSGKYTLQSVDNVLPGETNSGQPIYYASTLAEMYDYQYDYNNAEDQTFQYKLQTNLSNDSYNYSTYYPGKILLTSKDWPDEANYAYFYQGKSYVGKAWPGYMMTYVGRNGDNDKQYVVDVPDHTGTLYVIFNNDNNKQTADDVAVVEGKGYYTNGYNSSTNKYGVETWNMETQASRRGTAKRPYLAINEALSASSYASKVSNYPLYLGQFWLPVKNNSSDTASSNDAYATSTDAYSDSTVQQRAAHNETENSNRIKQGYVDASRDRSNISRFNGFGNILSNFNWSANLAYRNTYQSPGTYEPYNGVVRKLVKPTLNSDYQLCANDGTTLPYFDTSWWTKDGRNNFTTSQGNTVNLGDYIKTYEELTFPFFKESQSTVRNYQFADTSMAKGKLITDQSKDYTGNYYVFDSKKNVVRYNSTKKDLDKYYNQSSQLVGDTYGDGVSSPYSESGLFPFNQVADGKSDTSDGSNLHYGFGIKFSLDFYLNENGTVDGRKDGTPITFTFQGDDDVWVFLDDQLVLDMGGAHKNSIGEINFAKNNGYVTIGSAGVAGDSIVTNTAKSKYEKTFAQLDSDNGTSLVSKATTGKHKITMFYLERGMLNSNLFVMFNLPMSLTKWELQEDTDFGGVNQGFKAATKYVADRDVFNYAVSNKDTDPASVITSDYSTANNTSVTRKNTDASGRITTLSSGATSGGASKKFVPGTVEDTYYPVVSSGGGGVSYRLLDMYTQLTGTEKITDKPVIYETRRYGGSGDSNIVSVQSGELATFSKQFACGSAMKVDQLNTLSAPDGSRSTLNDSTGRTVSMYYNSFFQEDTSGGTTHPYRQYAGIYRGDNVSNTELAHVDTMYNPASSKNYSTNFIINPQLSGTTLNYIFRDPYEAANEYVHLRQVVVNEVKTASLTIDKALTVVPTENAVDTAFPFKITFSHVFGTTETSGVPAVSYTDIAIKKFASDGNEITSPPPSLGSDGSFTLKVGERIEIDGIPIGTHYKIEEGTVSNHERDTYVLDSSHSINIGSEFVIAENNNLAQAYNIKRTGSLKIAKILRNEDDSANVTDDTTSFGATVTLTNTSDDLSLYDIQKDGQHLNLTSGSSGTWTFNVTLTGGSDTTITGLPYDTRYEVVENPPPSGYIKKNVGATSSNVECVDNYEGSTLYKIDSALETARLYNQKEQTVASLTVKKLVFNNDTGAIMTSVQQEFPITIKLTGLSSDVSSSLNFKWDDTPLDPSKVTLGTYSSGSLTVTVSIKPGDTVADTKALVVENVPIGASYTISEIPDNIPAGYSMATSACTDSVFNNSDYRPTNNTYNCVMYKDKDVARSIGGDDDEVIVENVFTPIVMPETGGTPLIFLLPYGIIAIAVSGIALVIYKKKLQGASLYVKKKGEE